MQQMIFIADLIACSTCIGHHCAHHQELESIIQVVAACRIWCLVFKLSVWCGAEGIMVPDTCWASNKICNKNHLLHLVVILFPHMNEWVWSNCGTILKGESRRVRIGSCHRATFPTTEPTRIGLILTPGLRSDRTATNRIGCDTNQSVHNRPEIWR